MMVEKATALVTAQNLMERALELLDMTGQDYPALHLQMALDVLTDAPVPRTIEEADAMLDTAEGRRLLGRILESRDDEPSPEAAQRAASLIRLHKDKALGRARMQLYEALGRRDTAEVDLLSTVCSILMKSGRA